MSQVRGKTEDLTEGAVELRRGQTGGFNEEIGQMPFVGSRPRVGLKTAIPQVLTKATNE